MKSGKRKISSSQIIVLGFAGVIILGTLILMLPISSADRVWTPFVDSLFTATTSVCVTGLVVRDTATYWSSFGHAVILVMIQIGGLGVVTLAASLMMAAGRKIGLMQRATMQSAVSAHKLGGVARLTLFIVKGTLLVELVGAILMSPVFIRDFGWGRGIWMSVFHAVSMFCNAGIDLMGVTGEYSSFTSYIGNIPVNVVIMLLIIIGGLGFLTWDDILTHKLKLKSYQMQSKVILLVSLVLIFVPAIAFFIFEFGDLPVKERILASLFQSVTARTAGANTADLAAMSDAGKAGMIGLMLIGGNPGSTAGGMKTTTFAVLIGCAVAVFRKRENVQFFGRRVAHDVVMSAATISLMYVLIFLGGGMLISAIEKLPLLDCLFESASAVATVGLTLGITPTLSAASKCIVIAMMYIGRVGGLTLVYAALTTPPRPGKLPLGNITVG